MVESQNLIGGTTENHGKLLGPECPDKRKIWKWFFGKYVVKKYNGLKWLRTVSSGGLWY